MTTITKFYKYIHFVKISRQNAKTSVWSCLNNKSEDELGIIKYYPAWRQYCYFSNGGTVYSVGCMEDICAFIKQLEAERKIQNKGH